MEISGKKSIQEIIKDSQIKNYIEIIYLYKTQKDLINLCKKHQVNYSIQPKEFFNKHYSDKSKYKYKYAIANLKKPQLTNFDQLIRNFEQGTLVILDHIHDPFNLGAILRTCVAAGVKGVIIPKNNQAPINHSAVLKASQGYALKINLVLVSNLHQAILKLKKMNFWIYSSCLDKKSKNFKDIEYHKKNVLILGNEGNGVSQLVKEESDALIYIPMKSSIDSLNVSVAAGILLFEITK